VLGVHGSPFGPRRDPKIRSRSQGLCKALEYPCIVAFHARADNIPLLAPLWDSPCRKWNRPLSTSNDLLMRRTKLP
jgi:hypothetical protein